MKRELLLLSMGLSTSMLWAEPAATNALPGASVKDGGSLAKTGTVETGKPMTLDLGGEVKMAFVWVAALSGWVGQYEVTNDEYRRFKPDHNSGKAEGKNLNEDRQPVCRVNCEDVAAFTEWAQGQAKGLPPGYRIRLPTGEEWITFAQCGDGRTYPWGNKWPPKYGNYDEAMADYQDGVEGTCDVEESGKNSWGLFGVGGNVWEWTSEQVHVDQVLRGGGWGNFDKDFLRCDHKLRALPVRRDSTFGFRLVVMR